MSGCGHDSGGLGWLPIGCFSIQVLMGVSTDLVRQKELKSHHMRLGNAKDFHLPVWFVTLTYTTNSVNTLESMFVVLHDHVTKPSGEPVTNLTLAPQHRRAAA